MGEFDSEERPVLVALYAAKHRRVERGKGRECLSPKGELPDRPFNSRNVGQPKAKWRATSTGLSSESNSLSVRLRTSLTQPLLNSYKKCVAYPPEHSPLNKASERATMGKLTDMVTEDVSISERMKINARRVRLAGIGLFSRVESERLRLYKQITEMGDSYGSDDTLIGKLSLVSTGTVNLMIEETQKVFDDLVEEGERALAKDKPKLTSAAEKINTTRPVAKPKPVAAKPQAKPKTAVKTKAAKPALSEAMKKRFETARNQVAGVTDLAEQVAVDLLALEKQITEGDIKGRRPAQTKQAERAEFDARKELKGMKTEDALSRYESLVESLIPEIAE